MQQQLILPTIGRHSEFSTMWFHIPSGPDFCFLHGFAQILVLIFLSWITAPKIIKNYSGYLWEVLILAKKWRVSCSVMSHSWHGILQARILEWVVIPFSRRSSQPRNQTWVSCITDSLPSEPPGKPNTNKLAHNSSTLKQTGIKIENICWMNFSLHEETPQTNSDSKTIS